LRKSQKYGAKKGIKSDYSLVDIEFPMDINQSFSEILTETLDEAFTSLGESVKEAIYYHIENSMGIKKQDIPSKIDEFQTALEKIFGVGARHLEILFMKRLYVKINAIYKWKSLPQIVPELTFQRYLQIAKENIEEENLKNRGTKDATKKQSMHN
jgi:hypothetical protein